MTFRRTLLLSILAVALAAGCKDKASSAGGAPLPPGAIEVTADENGFKPSSVTFKKGAPASLVFTRTTDETCATEVVFPALDVKKDLPKGTAVTIDIPTDKAQKLTFQCGMGMYKSAVVID
ncbi:MAG: cupredoxin domain-containing protein [Labilithrix sp.]|nr:cupredoxin domain-containing protein [Labilithrix sp.]MBX3222414.1 cupredoxin domain-containing protein [Labilithrix sp.]